MSATERPTALIIGAGLSAASDFHLPTMQGFFGEGLESKRELQDFLHWFYPNQPPQEFNLEEVMSFLHLSSTRLQLWRSGNQANARWRESTLYEDLLDYVKSRLSIPTDAVCKIHRRLFETLLQPDTIISFNYDLLADNALLAIEPRQYERPIQDSRMGKLSGLLGRLDIWGDPPPSLMPREQEWGFYLKLHGSLDWLYCTTPGCSNNVNLFALSVAKLPEGQMEGLPCRNCGATLRTFIVPPIATKRLEDTGKMAFLWHLALRQLVTAERIVVVGISFAPSDFELRWLVRQAIALRTNPQYELHIVNPSQDHRRVIDSAFPGDGKVLYEYGSIIEYIEGYQNTKL